MFESGFGVITFGELVAQRVLEIGDGYRAKLEELDGDGPIFLRAGLLNDRGLDWKGAERFKRDAASKASSKMSQSGDTLVTTKGNSVGRTAYVPDGAPAFVYSPHLSYWRTLDGSRLSSRFLYYWSRSQQFMAQLQAMANSTDMAPYLSLTDQRRLKIHLPDIIAQNAIGQTLSALDDKIAANDRIATAGESLAMALVSSQRGSRRVRLTEIVEHMRDQLVPQSIDSDRVAHYSIPAFDLRRLPDLVPPGEIKSSKFSVSAPSVLVSKLNPATPRVWNIRHAPELPALASTEFLVLKPRTAISTDDLWAVCSQPEFIGSLAGKVTGTSGSHQRVKPDDLLATEVVDPRGITQEVRASISAIAGLVHEARKESQTLAELRDTLLPKLVSGEILLRDVEEAT
jgi:type I restriction enzyme, S subunit